MIIINTQYLVHCLVDNYMYMYIILYRIMYKYKIYFMCVIQVLLGKNNEQYK